jgi:hypothetical protein
LPVKVLEFLTLLLVIVLCAFGRCSRYWDWRSRDELKGIFPVYSAATLRNKEAEFIRDRLPKRFPLWIFSVALLMLAVVTWLFNH